MSVTHREKNSAAVEFIFRTINFDPLKSCDCPKRSRTPSMLLCDPAVPETVVKFSVGKFSETLPAPSTTCQFDGIAPATACVDTDELDSLTASRSRLCAMFRNVDNTTI